MTPRRRKLLLAVAAIAASVAALPVLLSSPPASQRALVEFAARVPCAGAKRFARDAAEFECAPGEKVYALLQVIVDTDGGTVGPDDVALPEGVEANRDSIRFPPMARAVRPGKVLTTLDPFDENDIVGEWATDAGRVWDGRFETSACVDPGCYCAGRCSPKLSVYVAGDENAQVRRLLCRAVPEHPSCPDGGP